MAKKFLSFLLSLAMLITMVPATGCMVYAEGEELPIISEFSITSELDTMVFDTAHQARFMDFTISDSRVNKNAGSCYWNKVTSNEDGSISYRWINQNDYFEAGEVAYHYSMYVDGSSYRLGDTVAITLDGEKKTYSVSKSGNEYYINFRGPSFTVIANAELPYYEVTFDTGCDAAIPSKKVQEGNKVYAPDAPENGDKILGGWYTDPECTIPYDFESPVTSDITLYAKWEEDTRVPISELSITSDLDSMVFDTDHKAKYMDFTISDSRVIKNAGSCYWNKVTSNEDGSISYRWINQNDYFEAGEVAYHYSMYVDNSCRIGDTVTIMLDGEKRTATVSKSGNEFYISFRGPIFTVTKNLIDINTLSWMDLDRSIPYTGKAIEPAYYEFLEEVPDNFVRHEQFETAYSNNVDPGTATLTITGIGEYTGKKDLKFTICKSAVSKITLSKKSYYYNGKSKKPSVSVMSEELNTIASKITKSNDDVKLAYASGRKLPGSYKVTAKGQGIGYEGSASATFKIVIKPTTIKTLTSSKKSFKITCEKLASTYASGYQIRYSTSSSMSKAKKLNVGSKNTTVTKTVKNLKANKKYYVQVRTYKTVDGKKYYSAWSAKKSVKTK